MSARDITYLPAPSDVVVPSELIVRMKYPGFPSYRGTRAMLEAERIIPTGTTWPEGYQPLYWQDGKFRYGLQRSRPDGAKGPRKLFLAVDWWDFGWRPLDAESNVQRNLRLKMKEVVDYAYRNSAEGLAQSGKEFRAFMAAREDAAFEVFKARVPGLEQPKRGRGIRGRNA